MVREGSSTITVPAWQLLAIGGRRVAAVAQVGAQWSVVLGGCCGSGQTLDEALTRALREPAGGRP